MSAPKGDWRIETGFVGLVLAIAMSVAMLFMWIYCNSARM